MGRGVEHFLELFVVLSEGQQNADGCLELGHFVERKFKRSFDERQRRLEALVAERGILNDLGKLVGARGFASLKRIGDEEAIAVGIAVGMQAALGAQP